MAQAARRRPRLENPRRESSATDPADVAERQVIQAIREYRREAYDARISRIRQNEVNWDAYHGRQDWSHKLDEQSKEFLPKVPMAVETICAFMKKALVDFGDWFSVDLPPGLPLSGDDARRLLKSRLADLGRFDVEHQDFPGLIADGIKVALLSVKMILKVHGRDTTRSRFVAERGVQWLQGQGGQVMPQITRNLVRRDVPHWQLLIDLIDPKDYYPDPTGRGLYEIHEVERDLHEIVEMSEGDDPVYDPYVVSQIETDFHQQEDEWRRLIQRGQDRASAPSFRKRVVLREMWGTILTPSGRVAEQNIVAAVANDKWLVRPPERNPYWHGRSPFVVTPLVRVPFSSVHKALFDHVVALNFAINELFNLMLDGGIAAVWGNKVVYPDRLDDPKQIKDGISQGLTLVAREGLPSGAPVLEQIRTGQVPQESIAMFSLVDREIQSADQVNDIKLGVLPPKEVRATEVVEAQQSTATFFDGMVRDIEGKCIEEVLYLSWCLEMQYMVDAESLAPAIGERAALALAQMSPAERYAAFAQDATFKSRGLSGTLARVRDFQKFLALMGAIRENPLLLQSFMAQFSAEKVLSYLMKALNIDPESMALDAHEQGQMDQRIQQVSQLAQVFGAGQNRGGAVAAAGQQPLAAMEGAALGGAVKGREP